MSPILGAVRLGFRRGWIEFNQWLRNPQEMIWTLFFTGIFIAVLWFQRNSQVEGMALSLLTLPSMLGMLIAQGGFAGVAGTLSYDREDGTLLRAKAVPQGMVGYLIARIMYTFLGTVISLILLFVPAAFLVDGLPSIGVGGALMLLALLVLGFLATAPWGAVVGSLVKSSMSGFGLTFLPMIVLVGISGIFYPITALAGWIQFIAQLFPIYWLGLGVRSVFLPDSAVAAELTGSWRTEETFIVLGIWFVIGMLIAPRILRRMARRESGSTVEARKQQTLSRGY